MGALPKISDAEWEVMKVVWRAGRAVSSETIVEALSHKDWQSKTVRTLIARLVKKRALAYQKSGRAYLYSALVSERDCALEESQSLLDRLFGGSLAPMLANLVEQRRLKKEDIAELEAILRSSSKETKKRG